ncbi:MAG: DNA-binding response regulator [Bacteroidales bacterium]|nr:MAG: DNA-binding response regulator [Bacteroidales bacterium]
MEKIRICITDDSQMFCYGIRSILEVKKRFEIAEASSSSELFSLLESGTVLPQLILLDVRLKRTGSLNGIQITHEVKKNYPSIKIIILTSYDESEVLKEAVEAGADGFLPKEAVAEELIEAIDSVLNGQNYMGKTIPFHAISYAFKKQTKKLDLLTKTEKSVFFMICRGLVNSEIADNLHISIHTVETHRSNIKSKLLIKSDIEYLKIAIEENVEEIMKLYKIRKS